MSVSQYEVSVVGIVQVHSKHKLYGFMVCSGP